MLVVDLDGDRLVADVGMDRVGEVERGGAARQRDDLRLRREHVDRIREQVDLHVFEEFGRVAGLLLDVEQRLQPRMGALLQVGQAALRRSCTASARPRPIRRRGACPAVRIWNSTGVPYGPISVVCSDW